MEPQHFLNREMSTLEFNNRVLFEAKREENPLLERLKYIGIVGSNLDEFFMVRVASIKRQYRKKNAGNCPTKMNPKEQLEKIHKRAKELISDQYEVLQEVKTGLENYNIFFLRQEDYQTEQREYLHEQFQREIFPVLSPVRIQKEKKLPFTGNLKMYIAYLITPLKGKYEIIQESEEEKIAFLPVPEGLNRFLYVPDKEDTISIAFLEDVILTFSEALFPGYTILEKLVFRVTRDADLSVDEERDEDFIEAMEEVLINRELSRPVRLEIDMRDISEKSTLFSFLEEQLLLNEDEIYTVKRPVALADFKEIVNIPNKDYLKYEPWTSYETPYFNSEEPIWDTLKKRDILLHHPYESFNPISRMLQSAANDKETLAIKITLYRTSGDSPIIAALEKAALNGKQVTALVELKARFDEERNIEWADRLEKAGVIVIYGIARLKVHSKALIIIRREYNGINRYLHLGTGNYNEKTAKLYTDLSFITSREDLCYESTLFFNTLTGYTAIQTMNKLSMAPVTLKERLLQYIKREAERSTPDNPGRIMAKMNSLSDVDIIEALHYASEKGVRISLNVRSICLLKPGIEGISDNIKVVSIIDRFLEHSRIFYFYNAGKEEVFCSSADWMPRNLERRVELMFPIEDRELIKRIKHILETFFQDNTHSHILLPDGTYTRKKSKDKKNIRAQEVFYKEVEKLSDTMDELNKKEFNVRRKPPKL